MSTERKKVPRSIAEVVLTEAGFRCAVPTCGQQLTLDLHHLEEVSQGGGNTTDNLLPLCPNCHTLYHRGGLITSGAIKQYKERLIALYNPLQINEEMKRQLSAVALAQLPAAMNATPQGHHENSPFGFAPAAGEFLKRTCKLCLRTGKRFLVAGYCTYVDRNLVVTSAEAMDLLGVLIDERGGEMAIMTGVGFASFEVEERNSWGGVTFLRTAEIYTAYWDKAAAEHGLTESDTARERPFRTKVRTRVAYVGETVGFANAPEATAPFRSVEQFQFEKAELSFYLRTEPPSIWNIAMSPTLSRLSHTGAPVFTQDGCLVGIIRDSIRVPGEAAFRPVMTTLVGVARFRAAAQANG